MCHTVQFDKLEIGKINTIRYVRTPSRSSLNNMTSEQHIESTLG